MAHAARTTARAGALLGAVAVGAWAALLPRVLKWGATDDEVVRPMPGDQLVDNPMYVTTRAITVAAPAAAVWPWLVQIGQNRGGFYSYDFFENVFRLDIHNADRIHEEWQAVRAGEDFVTLDPDGAMKLTIAVMEPERAFVILAGAPGEPPQEPGSFFRGELAFSWGFYLEPLDEQTTRLFIRTRAAWADTTAAKLAKPILLEPVHFLMEERMLRGIRDRAEASASQQD